LIKHLDVLAGLIRNKSRVQEYSFKESLDVRTLSSKKDTALGCLLAGIESVNTIPDYVKVSWFNWLFYAMRMISDKEVDALAESLSLGLEQYKMAYFSQDFIESLPSSKKDMAKALLYSHLNKLKGKTQISPSFKDWEI